MGKYQPNKRAYLLSVLRSWAAMCVEQGQHCKQMWGTSLECSCSHGAFWWGKNEFNYMIFPNRFPWKYFKAPVSPRETVIRGREAMVLWNDNWHWVVRMAGNASVTNPLQIRQRLWLLLFVWLQRNNVMNVNSDYRVFAIWTLCTRQSDSYESCHFWSAARQVGYFCFFNFFPYFFITKTGAMFYQRQLKLHLSAAMDSITKMETLCIWGWINYSNELSSIQCFLYRLLNTS